MKYINTTQLLFNPAVPPLSNVCLRFIKSKQREWCAVCTLNCTSLCESTSEDAAASEVRQILIYYLRTTRESKAWSLLINSCFVFLCICWCYTMAPCRIQGYTSSPLFIQFRAHKLLPLLFGTSDMICFAFPPPSLLSVGQHHPHALRRERKEVRHDAFPPGHAWCLLPGMGFGSAG